MKCINLPTNASHENSTHFAVFFRGRAFRRLFDRADHELQGTAAKQGIKIFHQLKFFRSL
jgi:hypothetical protein